MPLDFTNELMRDEALNIETINYENSNSSADAFLLVLKDLDYETINTLCIEVAKIIQVDDSHIVYDLIQSNKCDQKLKETILSTAYEIIHSNRNLGTKIVGGKFNASSWIEHSLYEGELASLFAEKVGLNPDTAKKLGILHDIGRKFDHSFMHTIKGYEYLTQLGYKEEAVCCLSHSFLSVPTKDNLKGNRCANCDPSLEGFYVDSSGTGTFREDAKRDDMTLFLENYQYNMYDTILNISDLMAKDSGIVSPYDRVMDVYTRKTPDPINSPFFKVCFINSLYRLLYLITNDDKYIKVFNINNMSSIEDIDKLFMDTSTEFMTIYNTMINNKKTMKVNS